MGIFITPDGMAPGALESLYLQCIGGGPIVDCVRDFMRCVSPEIQHMRVAQLAKVEFHAWLAACPDPEIQPGQALDANYIDRNSYAFGPLRRFLSDLLAAARASDTPP